MFTVPIIPPDLRHEETIIMAVHALDCLQTTINAIFDRIDKRIDKNNEKVEELQNRIHKSQHKLQQLEGTRKAIHIYAPARFPASHIFKEIPATFEKTVGDTSDKKYSYNVLSKLCQNLPNNNEKLVFFHVRDRNHCGYENSMTKERLDIKPSQQLGTMPTDLKSITSVLLFNSDGGTYSLDDHDVCDVLHSDNWKRAKLFKSKRQQKQNDAATSKQLIEPAPYSLAHRNEKLTPSLGLKYTPKLSEAPELDLPLDLPDLPGIADDLRYESEEGKQKIAPSLEMVVGALPEFNELLKEKPQTLQDNKAHTEGNATTKDAATLQRSATPPPPPPPPPPPSALVALPQPTAIPPPPPPPAANVGKTIPKPTPSPSADNNRSELMAAIRNAGGAGKALLRRTAAAPLSRSETDAAAAPESSVTKSKLSASKSAPGGDLMADLHNKLMMRRKGISGSKDTSGELAPNLSGNPVISRLSALIPPPPAAAAKSKNSDDDGDSNDTDWVD